MRYMQELMARMIDVPLARMFILAAILFLLLAVLGRIEGKIEPGTAGRIGATLLGVALLFLGLTIHMKESEAIKDQFRESLEAAPLTSTRPPVPPSGEGMVKTASANQTSLQSAEPSTSAAGKSTSASTIQVVAASYGVNCGAKSGNVTAQLARVCNGQARCDYKPDFASLEDPAPNCAKALSAEWKCGVSSAVYAVTLPSGEPTGTVLRLACSSS